ncbi:unnamed protein product [Linum tenue]|uniref:Neprosin PEP catalytic domain-containing protein n=2 Tax=Linum tenue TaxID=586396 RepID=A0AAV0RNS8_9ROSI|nr:unnamed protein product [Linum tenue]
MASSHYVIRSHRLSTEEDSELERQLKLLKKPAVTTIQTKYGDLYDCVDFYQQPAFDHPLLKDHKYEFKNHELNRRTNTDTYDTDTFDIWSNGKGCPSNTVPIRRITKQDLIKANRAAELRYNISLDLNPGVEVAMLRTTQQNKYYGGGMDVAVYHPAVQSTQYSSSHVKVENGPDSISVGWTVNPSLYPDNETRMFIYTTTKDSYCYNTYCPGFIISTTEVPIDLLLKPYTQIGGPLYEKKFFVRKDAANGDWFLVIGRTNITVGSWPQKIFTALADSANYVEWGGEVYSPPGTDPPPMGAGQKLQQKLYSDCYGRQVNLIDENHEIDHDPPSCETYQSSKRYQVIDEGFDAGPGIGRLIFFGGP